jgi:hypothetical protein
MSDHDTLTPDADDELRTRLRAFAEGVKRQTDTETALARMPHRSGPPHVRLLAIAAAIVAVIVVAALAVDRQAVDTVPPANTTECPPATQPRAIPSGGQMKSRFAKPIAGAATAALLLGACGDDDSADASENGADPTIIARGENIEFVGFQSLGAQTMDISAQREGEEVTGEVSFDPNGVVASIECADTEGPLILGSVVTKASKDGDEPVGMWLAVLIREGDPDTVTLWYGDPGTSSCDDVLEQAKGTDHPDDVWFEVEEGDIETG